MYSHDTVTSSVEFRMGRGHVNFAPTIRDLTLGSAKPKPNSNLT